MSRILPLLVGLLVAAVLTVFLVVMRGGEERGVGHGGTSSVPAGAVEVNGMLFPDHETRTIVPFRPGAIVRLLDSVANDADDRPVTIIGARLLPLQDDVDWRDRLMQFQARVLGVTAARQGEQAFSALPQRLAPKWELELRFTVRLATRRTRSRPHWLTSRHELECFVVRSDHGCRANSGGLAVLATHMEITWRHRGGDLKRTVLPLHSRYALAELRVDS